MTRFHFRFVLGAKNDVAGPDGALGSQLGTKVSPF